MKLSPLDNLVISRTRTIVFSAKCTIEMARRISFAMVFARFTSISFAFKKRIRSKKNYVDTNYVCAICFSL